MARVCTDEKLSASINVELGDLLWEACLCLRLTGIVSDCCLYGLLDARFFCWYIGDSFAKFCWLMKEARLPCVLPRALRRS